MSKAAFIKIAFALAVISLYTYVFGVMDIVSNEHLIINDVQLSASASDSDSMSEPPKLTEPAELDVSNKRMPGLADYNSPVANYVAPSTIDEGQFTTAATTAPAVTEGIMTLPTFTNPLTFSTMMNPASTNQNSPTPVGNPDSTSERFKIISGGQVIEGNAFNIVAQVVQGEVGGYSHFHDEAIKAQAVAAYTFIKNQNQKGRTPTLPAREPNERVKQCVRDVWGIAVYYNNELAESVFSASSAGWTSSAKNVWGSDIPYLRSKETPFDIQHDPNRNQTVTFTADEIKQNVQRVTGIQLTGNPDNWFKIINHVDGVYVGTFSIGGRTTYRKDGKDVQITGRHMREQIMGFKMRSAAFTFTYNRNRDTFTFTTNGYGHGVGMSQNGAHILAKEMGYDYAAILRFYFDGVEVR